MMMVNDFLLEIGCEELPPKTLKTLARALSDAMVQGLDKANLSYEGHEFYAAPRRLAVKIKGLEASQQDSVQTKRGPAVASAFDEQGNPTKAALGFARSCGVEFDALERMTSDKGEWLVHHAEVKGRSVEALMPEIINQALKQLPIAKPMRWGNEALEFVRPVHWIVMLYGDKVIDTEVLGQKASNQSYGHRFHHPQAVEINTPDDYLPQLEKAYVIADFNKRQAIIEQQIAKITDELNATAVMPNELVEEVTAIVEWPVAMLANFDEKLLEVPAEALIASMQQHQKSFAITNSKGTLLAHFIFVANIESHAPQQVVSGNEKVMRARLADAAFFFEQDNKLGLDALIEPTQKVIFQKKLGALYDKAQRVLHIAQAIAAKLNLDLNQVHRAATLAKCDLMTGMVGEFPELQGVMGYYYALNQNEDEAVAKALDEQYMPRFSGDAIPPSDIGSVLSLADRLDTLIGIFGIGQKPSGVKDPFKLRRHALAIIRILSDKQYPLDLIELLTLAQDQYADKVPNVVDDVHQFIVERLSSWYQGQETSIDVINAVKARQVTRLDDFAKRIVAVTAFKTLAQAQTLAQANKRVSKLLEKEGIHVDGVFDDALFSEAAEKQLADALLTMEQGASELLVRRDYQNLLTQLASLREPVDSFFDNVMVMVDDEKIRTNRLKLLARLRQLFLNVADISLLQ